MGLGYPDVSVTEKDGDSFDRDAFFEEGNGKRVSEHVRMSLHAGDREELAERPLPVSDDSYNKKSAIREWRFKYGEKRWWRWRESNRFNQRRISNLLILMDARTSRNYPTS